MSIGDAVRLLETAEVAESAPATMQALKAGELSTRKAHAAGRAEAADPDRGAELVGRAMTGNVSVKEIEQDSARIVNAASGDTEADRAERIRKNRRSGPAPTATARRGRTSTGPTAEIARLEAAIKPLLNDIFIDAREQGRRESRDAYAFDALMALVDRATTNPGGPANPSAALRRQRWLRRQRGQGGQGGQGR